MQNIKTILIKTSCLDPFFNLAMEEYFIDNFSESIILLWKNDKTVVIGRNQNAIEEINTDYVKNNNIKVVRRLSGGGAVFHDIGNLNFSFIQKYEKSLFNNYDFFTKPICSFLQTLGLVTHLSGRNDIMLDNKKISGNAQVSRNNRIMHHGTILFSSDIEKISNCLNPNPIKLHSNGVKSVHKRVTTIKEYLTKDLSIEDFTNSLYQYLLDNTTDIEEYFLSKTDEEIIQKLANEKYSSFDWNYKKSPKFTFENTRKFDYGLVKVSMIIKNFCIKDIKISGDFFGLYDIEELEKIMFDCPFTRLSCEKKLEKVELDKYISGMKLADIIMLFGF